MVNKVECEVLTEFKLGIGVNINLPGVQVSFACSLPNIIA